MSIQQTNEELFFCFQFLKSINQICFENNYCQQIKQRWNYKDTQIQAVSLVSHMHIQKRDTRIVRYLT